MSLPLAITYLPPPPASSLGGSRVIDGVPSSTHPRRSPHPLTSSTRFPSPPLLSLADHTHAPVCLYHCLLACFPVGGCVTHPIPATIASPSFTISTPSPCIINDIHKVPPYRRSPVGGTAIACHLCISPIHYYYLYYSIARLPPPLPPLAACYPAASWYGYGMDGSAACALKPLPSPQLPAAQSQGQGVGTKKLRVRGIFPRSWGSGGPKLDRPTTVPIFLSLRQPHFLT